MKRERGAQPETERDGGHPAKPPENRPITDPAYYAPPEIFEQPKTAPHKLGKGRLSINRLVAWLGRSGHTFVPDTLRAHLVSRGFDLGKGVDPLQAAPCAMEILASRLAQINLDIDRDKARAAAAAADTAEIELEKLKGNLVSRDEIRRVVENMVVTYREKVRGMDDLSLEQRKAVCEALVNFKLDDDAPER